MVTEQANTQTSKKKTSFSKFLRGLKTVHRKEKHGTSSPRHGRDSRLQGGPPNSRVSPNINLTLQGGKRVEKLKTFVTS